MKVVVIGATGFIGFPVCQAFVRAGHTVYGVTRTAEKAKKLIAEEIHPIVGDPTSSWIHLVPTIDAVIQLSRDKDIPSMRQAFNNTIDNFSRACKESRSPSAPKIAFIQTSGTAIYGDNRVDVHTDLSPIDNNPNTKVSSMIAELNITEYEQKVLKSQDFNGIVIRAGMTYGRSGSRASLFFKMALEQDAIVLVGGPGIKWSGAHVDDVADLYLRAAERAPIVAGLTFVATSEIISSDEFAKRVVELSGAKGGVVYKEASNPAEEAFAASHMNRPHLAKTLLGWSPKKLSLVENLETYFYASLASNTDEKSAKFLKERFSF